MTYNKQCNLQLNLSNMKINIMNLPLSFSDKIKLLECIEPLKLKLKNSIKERLIGW